MRGRGGAMRGRGGRGVHCWLEVDPLPCERH